MKGTILVTGGAGYIGSHVCKSLHSHGLTPVTFDNLSKGSASSVKWGPLVKGDLLDRSSLEEVFDSYAFDAVIHMAASTNVRESVINPAKYYRNNVCGSLNLLEVMAKKKVQKLIFSSTAAVYGNPLYVPIDEKHPTQPINAYGQSKLMIESMIQDFAKAYGLSAVVFRYFNAAGADLDGEIGPYLHQAEHLIPIILEVAFGVRPSLSIFGSDFDTPDGTAIRDYIHVMDLAEAHYKGLLWLLKHEGFLSANLGTGRGHSVKEVLDAITKVHKKPITHQIIARAPGDPAALTANPSKAEKTLDWKARYSDLDTIITSSYNWFSSKI